MSGDTEATALTSQGTVATRVGSFTRVAFSMSSHFIVPGPITDSAPRDLVSLPLDTSYWVPGRCPGHRKRRYIRI